MPNNFALRPQTHTYPLSPFIFGESYAKKSEAGKVRINYTTFGALLPDRQWYANSDSSAYSFGFGGQMKDDEVSGIGNSYTAEYWQYDPRLGRRFNIDPVVKPWESPYACYANNPILLVDPDGADTSSSQGQGQHTIQAGETLSGIAKKYSVSVNDLAKWNKIKDKNKIIAGETLHTSDPTAQSSGWHAPMVAPASDQDDQKANPVIPIASLGLTVVGTGSGATLAISDYTKFNTALKEGKFITTYNGSEVTWSKDFHGNKAVSGQSVKAGKAAFSSTTTTLKVIKGIGVVASVGGAGISIYQYSQGDISGGKLTADLVMTGVAFVPGVGWVISGAYFLVDGTVGWGNAIESFDRLDTEHRRITGKGIMQGPKF